MAYVQEEWIPLTGLGRMVAAGEITSIDEVLASGRPIKEPRSSISSCPTWRTRCWTSTWSSG